MASLVEHMQDLLRTQTLEHFADVELAARVEGKEEKVIPCNSHILARSPVFARMFQGGFSESRSRRAQIHVASASHLDQLVQYAYTDKMDFTHAGAAAQWTCGDTIRLLGLLQFYEMPGGSLACASDMLRDQLRSESFRDVMNCAKLARSVGVPASALEVLRSRMVESATFGQGHIVGALAWVVACGDADQDQSQGFIKKLLNMLGFTPVYLVANYLTSELKVPPEEEVQFWQVAKALVLTEAMRRFGTEIGGAEIMHRELLYVATSSAKAAKQAEKRETELKQTIEDLQKQLSEIQSARVDKRPSDDSALCGDPKRCKDDKA